MKSKTGSSAGNTEAANSLFYTIADSVFIKFSSREIHSSEDKI